MSEYADKLRHTADVYDAVEKGEIWEVKPPYHEWYTPIQSLNNLQECIRRHAQIRLKPNPTIHPWSKPEDVPAICWLRHGNYPRHVGLIVGLSDEGLDTIGLDSTGLHPCFTSWNRLDGTEYSTDRKTWQPCTIKE